MTRLVARHAPAIKADRSMLAAAVPGNAHDIGLRMVTDMFRLAGWRCLFLGANVPASEIANAAVSQDVDLVVLSATLATQLKELEHAIAMIRAAGARARILAGGLAFADAPALWRQLGADGYASDLDAAVAAGERLVAASH
jgi:methanogenic corrinoid protein MtbC1